MEPFMIPPSPNWYESEVMACAPDNTIMYGSRNSLIVIKTNPTFMEIIPDAHFKNITVVNFNNHWNAPNKYAVTASADNVIKLWDVETLKRKMSHNKHCSNEGVKVIGVAFAGQNRIVSATSEGQVIIWNIINNEHTVLDSIFKTVKGTLTSFSICPHEGSRAAFGMKNGLVIIVDLRGNGKILATYRGHKSEVTSMSWCPVPVNIFPKNPNNKVGQKKKAKDETVQSQAKEMLKELQKDGLKVDMDLFWEIFKVNGETDSIKNTPTDRRNLPMELSYSTEHQPNIIIDPETDSTVEDGKTKTDKLNTNAASTDVQKSSKQNTANEKLNVFDELPPVENWRVEAVVPKVEEEPRKEYLLATTARDGYVYIWQTLGGPLATFFTIPFTKYKGKNKTTGKDVFNVLCWVTPHTLLSSANSGELLAWTLPKPGGLSKAYKKIHNYHGKPITSIKAPISYDFDETNFLETRKITVWTTGLDRIVCNFDCDSKELIMYYQSLNGSSCYLTGCPLDPSRLAIGDEKNIKILNVGQGCKQILKFPTTFEKIHSVITAMAWHPSDENKLAFGTQEGRIGILTISGNKLKTKVLPQYFKSEIYKLEWGPGNKYGLRNLFALSGGVVVRFDVDTDEEPVPIAMPKPDADETKASVNIIYTFSWCPDYSFFLASSKGGGCIKFDKYFECDEVFYVNWRIDSIVWHPDAYACQNDTVERTEFSTVFASVSNASTVRIYNHNIVNGKTKLTPYPSLPFYGNKSRIRDLRWSPFTKGFLAWVDAAGIAMVVDITRGAIIYTYINPWLDSLVSLYWSPIDPNFIILASDNRTLLCVNITRYRALHQTEIESLINNSSKKHVNELTHNLPKAKENKKEKEDSKGKNKKSPLGVNVFYTIKETNQVSDLRKLLQWKLKGNTSDDEVSKSSSCKIGVLDVFGDDSHFDKIFQLNISSLTQNNHTDKVNMMALIQGNINETIKDAIEQKRVTTWIISIASMVSPQCWKDACKTYVEQLLEQSDSNVFEVVAFQLVCHQVEEAVKFLCDRKHFREAYVLAKKRLGSGHEIINTILSQWGNQCSYEGNYELAACCYIMVGMFSEAAYLLFRRTNVEMLDFAAHLATLAGNNELEHAIKDKVEGLRKPVDLSRWPPPHYDHKGDILTIFTPRSPGYSDGSDDEVIAQQGKPVKTTEKPKKEAQTEAKEENTGQSTTVVVKATEKPQEEAHTEGREENTDQPTTAVVREKANEKQQEKAQSKRKENTDQLTPRVVKIEATEKPPKVVQTEEKDINTNKPTTAVVEEKANEKPQESQPETKQNTSQPTPAVVKEKPQNKAQLKAKEENTDQPTPAVVKVKATEKPPKVAQTEKKDINTIKPTTAVVEEKANEKPQKSQPETKQNTSQPTPAVVKEKPQNKAQLKAKEENTDQPTLAVVKVKATEKPPKVAQTEKKDINTIKPTTAVVKEKANEKPQEEAQPETKQNTSQPTPAVVKEKPQNKAQLKAKEENTDQPTLAVVKVKATEKPPKVAQTEKKDINTIKPTTAVVEEKANEKPQESQPETKQNTSQPTPAVVKEKPQNKAQLKAKEENTNQPTPAVVKVKATEKPPKVAQTEKKDINTIKPTTAVVEEKANEKPQESQPETKQNTSQPTPAVVKEKPQNKAQLKAKEENTDQPTPAVVKVKATEKPPKVAQTEKKDINTIKPTTAVVEEKANEKPQKSQPETKQNTSQPTPAVVKEKPQNKAQLKAKEENTDQPTLAVVKVKATEKPPKVAQTEKKDINTIKPTTAVVEEKANEKPQESQPETKQNTSQPTPAVVKEKPQNKAQLKAKEENTDQPTLAVVKVKATEKPPKVAQTEKKDINTIKPTTAVVEEKANEKPQKSQPETKQNTSQPTPAVVKEKPQNKAQLKAKEENTDQPTLAVVKVKATEKPPKVAQTEKKDINTIKPTTAVVKEKANEKPQEEAQPETKQNTSQPTPAVVKEKPQNKAQLKAKEENTDQPTLAVVKVKATEKPPKVAQTEKKDINTIKPTTAVVEEKANEKPQESQPETKQNTSQPTPAVVKEKPQNKAQLKAKEENTNQPTPAVVKVKATEKPPKVAPTEEKDINAIKPTAAGVEEKANEKPEEEAQPETKQNTSQNTPAVVKEKPQNEAQLKAKEEDTDTPAVGKVEATEKPPKVPQTKEKDINTNKPTTAIVKDKTNEKPQDEAQPKTKQNTSQPTPAVVKVEATEKPPKVPQTKEKDINTNKPTAAVVKEKANEKPQEEAQPETKQNTSQNTPAVVKEKPQNEAQLKAKEENTDQPTIAVVQDKATDKTQNEAQSKAKEENTDQPTTAVVQDKATGKPQNEAQSKAKEENTDQPATAVVQDRVTEKQQNEAQSKAKEENTDQSSDMVVQDCNNLEGSDHEESYELVESPNSFIIIEDEADVSTDFEVVENISGTASPFSDVVEELEDLKLEDNLTKTK